MTLLMMQSFCLLLGNESAIMRNMSEKIQIRDLRGTPYQNGCLSGSYFRDRVRIEVDDIVSFMHAFPECCKQMQYQMAQLKNDIPSYYEETIGKADGLGIDRDVYMMLMHPEIMQEGHESCTTIMVRNTDGTFSLCHNEDDIYRKGNLAFVRVFTEDGWFITNDMYNMPLGNGILIHESGLVRSINYCYDTGHSGISRYYCQRHIAGAGTVNDLKTKAMEMTPASGFHVNVIDPACHIGQSIEVRSDGIFCRDVSSFLVHTNHYMYGLQENMYCQQPGGNSIFRYDAVMEQMKKHTEWTVEMMSGILDQHTDDPMTSIFQCHSDDNRTLFRFCYDGSLQKSEFIEYEHGKTFTMQEGI